MERSLARIRPEQGLGWALVALFVLAQIAGLAHRTFEAHEVCAEHGELVHAGETPGSLADEDGRRDERRGPQARPAPEPDEHHPDHCGLDLGAPERVVTGAPRPAGLGMELGVARSRVRPSARRRGSIAVLHLAPKQSPPAVA